MLRAVGLLLFALAGLAQAAIWPEQWWAFKRSDLAPIAPEDPLVWEEYGLQEAEAAKYTDGKANFTVSAWRLRDSTSAFAVAQWKLAPGYKPAQFEETAWQDGNKYLWVIGNYIFQLEGDLPEEEKRQILYVQLPRLEKSALPVLPKYLPAEGLIAASRRYLVGPVSLEKFEPRIPPSIAAFHLGAEGQLGHYQSPKGDYSLLVFNYPTPNIARKQLEEFSKLDGVVAKRTGPLVALAIGAADKDVQERTLAKINYEATLSWSQPTQPKPEPNMGDVILSAFKLVGLVIVFTIVGGAFIAGVKWAGRRWLGWARDDEAMLTLHIDDRSRQSHE